MGSFDEYLRHEVAGDPELAEAVAEERFSISVGREIARARKACGLSQARLAKKAEMHQSVVARLESADYDGHSISTLKKIAAALNGRLEVRFVDVCGDEDAEQGQSLCAEEVAWESEWTPHITSTNVADNELQHG